MNGGQMTIAVIELVFIGYWLYRINDFVTSLEWMKSMQKFYEECLEIDTVSDRIFHFFHFLCPCVLLFFYFCSSTFYWCFLVTTDFLSEHFTIHTLAYCD
jgi:hypothetical protein